MKVKDLFLLIIINCLVFQCLLQENIKIFQYFDEMIAVFLGIYYVLKCKGKINIDEFIIICVCIVITLVGICGTIVFQYQTGLKAILMDFFNFFKYIITFLGAYTFFSDKSKIKILNNEAKFVMVITVITVFFMIVNLMVGIDSMTYEYRYGIRAFQFIYGHPGTLTGITTFFCIFLILQIFEGKSKKIYLLGLLLNMIILISTLRSRAIVMSVIIFILLYMFYFRKNKRINYKLLIGMSVVLAFFIAYEQFENYFISTDRTPRLDLLRGGIRVMLACFPIGAGFATYGSFAASKYYSVLYYKFKFYNNYGMTPKDGQFLTDNFWPIVMGEFGVIGLLLYIVLLWRIIKIIWKRSNTNYKKCISMLIMFTILFNSLVSASFVHYTTVTYMFILALILKMNMEKDKIS